jgi:hypothetical protein
MMKKVTRRNFRRILQKIEQRFAVDEKEVQEVWADALNRMLDELNGEDFFGTEGQLDVRGDNRK